MPAMLPAAAASTALGTGAAVGAGLGSLGTGLAAGASLAGGVGLFGKLGLSAIGTGLGGAGTALGGAALTPAVASLAPAATAQAMGPSMLQSAGLEALKGKVIGGGVQQAAAQNIAGLANPTLAQQIAQQQTTANLARQQLLAQSGTKDVVGMGLQKSAATSPYDLSTGLRTGVDPRFAGQQGIQTAASPTVNPADVVGRSIRPDQNFMQNLGNIGSFQDVKDYAEQHPYATSAMAGLGAMGISKLMQPKKIPKPEDNAMIRPYTFERTQRPEAYAVSPTQDSSERLYFNDQFNAGEPYKAAEGGIASAYAMGGPVEQMAAMNAVGANTGYPQAGLQTPMYSNPAMQRPQAANVVAPSADAGVNTYTGEARFARGGEANLGDYSDGGRLLKGPGDGVSDSIPAVIGKRQPARLADGEFVIPARIVSELGNGSTEAGARKLYAMMERVQSTRKKSIGKKKVAVNSKADKHLPA